jgi:hypothetical protein
MASVAPGSQVSEDEPQVRSDSNRHLVVGVQMSLTTLQPLAQFVQNPLDRWVAQFEVTAIRDDLRLPPAIHTSPSISLEAKDPKLSMVCVIPTLGRRSSLFIPLPPRLVSVVWAVRLAIAESLAPRRLARLFGRTRHRPSPSRSARVAPRSAHAAAGDRGWHHSA